MSDITTRYKLELDSVGLMGQLAAVEAQAGGQIAQMVQPIQSSIMQTFQAGTQAISAAGGVAIRAASYMSPGQMAGTGMGAAALMGGGALFSSLYPPMGPSQGFFAADLPASGIRQGFLGTGLRALDVLPQRDYRYTPEENRFRYAQQFTRNIENAVLGTARTGLEMAGAYGGYDAGQRLGGALGRGLFGEAGGEVLGGMGGVAGAALGRQAYGPIGGATLGSGLGGTLGGLVGNIPILKDLPIIGSALRVVGAVGGAVGTVLGGATGAVAGGFGQLALDTIAQRNALRPLIEQIGMTSVLAPNSANPLGTGFTQAQSQAIGRDLSQMLVKDFRYDYKDYAKVMQGGAEAGRYENAGATVQEFTQTTQKLINDTKAIQTGLRKNVDESVQFMKEVIRSHGIRADIPQVVGQMRAISKQTGLTPDQQLQYGITGPGFGAQRYLGGVPEIAREMGLSRAQVLDAGMEGVAMAKGRLFDSAGFRTRIATTAGAWDMSRGSESDRQYVAAAGGPDRLAQATQGAMQSFLFSDAAKMQALAGGPRGSWADTAAAAMGRMQSFEDFTNFELDYAEKASKLSPQEVIRRQWANAQMIAKELPLGARGAEYIMFRQLQQQGYSPLQAKAIMRNQLRTGKGAGQIREQDIQPEQLESAAEMDLRREKGPVGTYRKWSKGVQGRMLNIMNQADEGYYGKAMQNIASWLQGGDVDDRTVLQSAGSALKKVTTGAVGLLKEEVAPLLKGMAKEALPQLTELFTDTVGKSEIGEVAQSGIRVAKDTWQSLTSGSTYTAMVGAAGAAAGAISEWMGTPKSSAVWARKARGTAGAVGDIGASLAYGLGSLLGFGDTETYAHPQAGRWIAATPGGVLPGSSLTVGGGVRDHEPGQAASVYIEPSATKGIEASDTPINAWVPSPGGVAAALPDMRTPDISVYDDREMGSSADFEKKLQGLAQHMRDTGKFSGKEIQKWMQEQRQAWKERHTKKERQDGTQVAQTDGATTINLIQVLAGKQGVPGGTAQKRKTTPAEREQRKTDEAQLVAAAPPRGQAYTAEEQKFLLTKGSMDATATFLGGLGLGQEDPILHMLSGQALGKPAKNQQDLHKSLLRASGTVKGFGRDGRPIFKQSVTPQMQAAVMQGAKGILEFVWDPESGKIRQDEADILVRGSDSLQAKKKAQGGLAPYERTPGLSGALRNQIFSSLYAPMQDKALDIYRRLDAREGGGFSDIVKDIRGLTAQERKDLQGTPLGRVAGLSAGIAGLSVPYPKAWGVIEGMSQKESDRQKSLTKMLTHSGIFTEDEAKKLVSSGLQGGELQNAVVEQALKKETGASQVGLSGEQATNAVNLLTASLTQIYEVAKGGR